VEFRVEDIVYNVDMMEYVQPKGPYRSFVQCPASTGVRRYKMSGHWIYIEPAPVL